MSSELTRAITEAISSYWSGKGTERKPPVVHKNDMASDIAAALTPLIEARVRDARAEALTEAAEVWTQGAWASTPRRKDRVADRMAASQYAGDWLRERAEDVRRG